MSNEPWLIPDPNYIPLQTVGVEAEIPLRFQIDSCYRSVQDNSEYVYKVFVTNELAGILGAVGQQMHEFPAVMVDEFIDNTTSVNEFPKRLPGAEVNSMVKFRIEGVFRDPARSNAYIYKLRIVNINALREIIGDLYNRDYDVLAKGVDEYLAALTA